MTVGEDNGASTVSVTWSLTEWTGPQASLRLQQDRNSSDWQV